jgi:hypothetical protein
MLLFQKAFLNKFLHFSYLLPPCVIFVLPPLLMLGHIFVVVVIVVVIDVVVVIVVVVVVVVGVAVILVAIAYGSLKMHLPPPSIDVVLLHLYPSP